MFLIVPICPTGSTDTCSPVLYIIPLVLGGFAFSFFGAGTN